MENTVKYFTLKLAAAATLSAALSSAAVAGGFMLTEQSVAGLGRVVQPGRYEPFVRDGGADGRRGGGSRSRSYNE